jgi:DNA-binding MarR family transcriptional regulator
MSTVARRTEREAQEPTARLLYRLWLAENAISRAMDEALHSATLSIAQFAVLFHLDLLGESSAAGLARLIHVTPQGVAATVSGLVRQGLVTKASHPTHGRIVLLQLTAAGRRAVAEALPIVERLEGEITADLRCEDRDVLGRALERMRERAATTWAAR